MLKILIKKQMEELLSFIFVDKRRNRSRTVWQAVLVGVVYLILLGVIGANFYVIASTLAGPLHLMQLDWMYFAIFGLIALVFGLFGSMLSTYNSLYVSKDNDLLFSMPIKPRDVLAARLSGVYLLALAFVLIVMIPVQIAYFTAAKPPFTTALLSAAAVLLLSLLTLSLSCLLGRGLAGVLRHVRNKTLITVLFSLAFVALYYYLYVRASSIIQSIIADPTGASDALSRYVYPIYQMGLGAAGSVKATLIFAAITLGFSALVYLFVSSGFYKLVISGQNGSAPARKRRYSEKELKTGSVSRALLAREYGRFFSSANYLLNCGFGSIMMLLAAAALFIKGRDIVSALSLNGISDYTLAIAGAIVIFMVCSSCSTAPSVSLEGTRIWIVQSLPVPAKNVLLAKLGMCLSFEFIPLAALTAAMILAIRPSAGCAAAFVFAVFAFAVFVAALGLALNLKAPNLSWTNEVVPIKQSMPVTVVVLGGMVLAGLYVLGFFLLKDKLSPDLYLGAAALVFAIAAALLIRWITTRGAKIFETLN